MDRTKKLLASSSLNLQSQTSSRPKKVLLSAEQRLENEHIIQSMNHKLNYLRNPRNIPQAINRLLIKSEAAILESIAARCSLVTPREARCFL
jgi:hypothetical protein